MFEKNKELFNITLELRKWKAARISFDSIKLVDVFKRYSVIEQLTAINNDCVFASLSWICAWLKTISDSTKARRADAVHFDFENEQSVTVYRELFPFKIGFKKDWKWILLIENTAFSTWIAISSVNKSASWFSIYGF